MTSTPASAREAVDTSDAAIAADVYASRVNAARAILLDLLDRALQQHRETAPPDPTDSASRPTT